MTNRSNTYEERQGPNFWKVSYICNKCKKKFKTSQERDNHVLLRHRKLKK